MNTQFVYLAITVLLSFFVGGKWNIPLAAWIAPVFGIRFFRDSDKPWRSFLLLWAASAVVNIISWQGGTAMGGFGPFAEPIFFILVTPIGLLPYVIDRLYYRRFGSSAWLTLVYPLVATAADFFSASGSPFGSFGAASYSQRDFPFVMQIAAVTGLWGITFVMSWFASLVNQIWESGFKFSRLTLVFSAVFILILGLSIGRSLLPAQPSQTAVVAGFSMPNGSLAGMLGQLKSGNETGFRQAVDELHSAELAQIRTLAQTGANIVALQEGAGLGLTDQVESLLNKAAAIAREESIYIVLPTFDLGKAVPENVVQIIDPQGEIVLRHVKYGGNQFEGTLKGDGVLQSVETPYGRLSAVICWDADFPDIMRQAGKQKVALLFVPANDWVEVRDIHAGMATFRSVENGLTIFRQTGQGVSLVSDAYGKILSRVDSFNEPAAQFAGVQRVETPVQSLQTLYPEIGDLAGLLAMLASLGLLIGLWVARKK